MLLLSDRQLPQQEEILGELAETRTRVTKALGISPGEREVVVYLFSDRNRYASYMQKTHPDLPARRAFFIGTPRELAVYAHWGEHVMVDLRHEFTHGLMHAAIGHVPLWLDEGIAEYFEVGSGAPGDINSEHLGWLAQAGANGWQPNLRRLEELEGVRDMDREDYHEAWAWVHFLLHSAPGGREMISNYLRGLRRGESPPPLSAQLDLRSAELELVSYTAQLAAGYRIAPAGFFGAAAY